MNVKLRIVSFTALVILLFVLIPVFNGNVAMAQTTASETQGEPAYVEPSEDVNADSWTEDASEPAIDDQDVSDFDSDSLTPESKPGAGAGSNDLIDGDSYRDNSLPADSDAGSMGTDDTDAGATEDYSDPETE
ncbi:MAG: hypothetical protein CVV64_06850 [Candidatus Wallbacteria bacterium HGW-Wallbacteria-1]|jgi:hypothetical protein|uniref:Uncharacterized protein n=1 Tax=Candidatus Wallbacteria bacterium HGW-Wallbacteria-1 TaxID=2013854 RepID=A0A2N1PSZ8_9BACT|nr:MAG: hypothetical protein CVV64_06850 [Candidatus Wallbacteria bacterium HGW-Wallbacteria-1]